MAAAAEKFSAKLLSPEGVIAEEDVTMLGASTVDGEIAVLKDHIPMVTPLQPGLVSLYKEDGHVDQYFVADGFLEVKEKSAILVEEAVPVKDMDAGQIEKGLSLLDKQYDRADTNSQKEALKSDRQILKAKLELIQRLKK